MREFRGSDFKPVRATEGSACYDIRTISEGIVMPNESIVCHTGVYVKMQPDDVLLIFSRSGMGFKNSIVLSNGTGVIDSDYDGEIMVSLRNEGKIPYRINRGDKICQAMFTKRFLADDDLIVTKYRTGGFGSTGR